MEATKVIGLGAAAAAGMLSVPLLGQIDKATSGKYLYLSGGGALALGIGLGYWGRHPALTGLGYALAAIGGYVLVADYQAQATAAQASATPVPTTTSGYVGQLAGRPRQTTVPSIPRQVPGRATMPPRGAGQTPLNRGATLSPSRVPAGTPEFPPTTPGGYPGWKAPLGDLPYEASFVPPPPPVQKATINPPGGAGTCYASPDGGGMSISLAKGIVVTVLGSKVDHGSTFVHIAWYGGSGWIDANCLS